MKILERLRQPAVGATSMLLLLAAIELGIFSFEIFYNGISLLMKSEVHQWMLVSSLISVSMAWRLIRGANVGRRDFVIVLLHALACWRFLSIELAVLASLPVFALAAAILLDDDKPGEKTQD